MVSNSIPSETYLHSCARSMWREFGGILVIQITQASDRHLYPAGLWFDGFVGSAMDVAGIDFASTPNLFIMNDGSSIPCDYAEIVRIIRA